MKIKNIIHGQIISQNKQNVARTFDLILAKFHGAATSKPQVKGGEQT